MNRVEWCAYKIGVLDRSIHNITVLAEHELTSTWKMLSAREMGTFSKPKLGAFAIVRALAILA